MLKAGAQWALLEASAAREEPRVSFHRPRSAQQGAHHQHPPSSSPAPAFPGETLGGVGRQQWKTSGWRVQGGLWGAVWPRLLPPVSTPGKPGTAGPGWHWPSCLWAPHVTEESPEAQPEAPGILALIVTEATGLQPSPLPQQNPSTSFLGCPTFGAGGKSPVLLQMGGCCLVMVIILRPNSG